MEEHITHQEILEVITRMGNNKAPGLDGLTGELYKTIKQNILPDLHRVYNCIIDNTHASLHPLNDSHIVLIPKKGAVQAADIRPISLINYVQKVLSKVMANMQQMVIVDFVLEG